MKSPQFLFRTVVLSLLFSGLVAHAAPVTGTVTNKTANQPSVGDTVALVDPQAGMKDVLHSVTDGDGRYTLNASGGGSYLVRVTHQGVSYYIEAPRGAAHGDITVYDVAAKVNGISIEADILDLESESSRLDVTERYLVHNTSSPRMTLLSANTFEFALPAAAMLDGAGATRPNGLPTNATPLPLGKGHFTINVPIQPDEGENDTLFEIRYHLPYAGKLTITPQLLTPVDNLAIRMPKNMSFMAGAGSIFRSVDQSAAMQTFVLKNALPGKPLEFTVSGNGSLPRQDQNDQNAQNDQAKQNGQSSGSGSAGAGGAESGAQPGGGIGNPANTPDPLSKYKWWILGGMALLMSAGAAFVLRKPPTALAPNASAPNSLATNTLKGAVIKEAVSPAAPTPPAATAGNEAQLNALKEELFALESDRIAGKIAPEEYEEAKAALETVLKRALKRNSH
jgi:hypothetical protein